MRNFFEKIEKTLFYILIFSIPFQIRIILFQEVPFNEWNGIYFYFTDLLLGLVFVLWLIYGFTQIRAQIHTDKSKRIIDFNIIKCKPEFILIIFFAAAGSSLFGVQNLGVGVFRWIKLGEFILLFLYCRSRLIQIRAPVLEQSLVRGKAQINADDNKSGIGIKRIFQIFVASGVFQSLFAIGQFFSQSDLGLKHFEAGPFGPDIAGVAKIAIAGGAKIIRAYGTFPHPNVLAAFLLVAIFGVYYLFITHRFTQMRKQINADKSYLLLITYHLSLPILMFAFFLTFSRAAIFAFMAGSLILFFILIRKFASNSHKIQIIISIVLLFIVYSSLFSIILWPELSSRVYFTGESGNLALRSFYNRSALSMIKNNPLFGVGIGNFVKNIEFQVSSFKFQEWIFQPVHNLYLLIASETGFIGFGAFLLFIFLIIKKAYLYIQAKTEKSLITYHLLLITFAFLFLAFFDHYFWTLQQGGLMFWITLGILAASKKTR